MGYLLNAYNEAHIRNLIERACWTFAQAFLGTLLVLGKFDKASVVAALSAALSALKTLGKRGYERRRRG